MTTQPSKSELSLVSSVDHDLAKRGKPKPFSLLSRTRSIKDRDSPGASPNETTTFAPASAPRTDPNVGPVAPAPLHTAPIQAHDRSFRDMMSSAARNHSADRAQSQQSQQSHQAHQAQDISVSKSREPGRDHGREVGRDYERDHSRGHASSIRDNGGSAFFSGLKNSSSKAADMISKGLFGKAAKGGLVDREREPAVDDEHYVLKVINLPLVEQTRRTRISKRLEESRDKTEFWMPAFPWRAIDYLNYKGSDVEGLYRVPGSGPQIKKWQRRFDEGMRPTGAPYS